MAAYLVRIQGTNFLVEVDGKLQRLGFLTARQVEAQDIEDAEAKAIDMMRTLPTLRERVQNHREDPPRMYVTEVSEVAAVDKTQPVPGLAWYPDDEAPN